MVLRLTSKAFTPEAVTRPEASWARSDLGKDPLVEFGQLSFNRNIFHTGAKAAAFGLFAATLLVAGSIIDFAYAVYGSERLPSRRQTPLWH